MWPIRCSWCHSRSGSEAIAISGHWAAELLMDRGWSLPAGSSSRGRCRRSDWRWTNNPRSSGSIDMVRSLAGSSPPTGGRDGPPSTGEWICWRRAIPTGGRGSRVGFRETGLRRGREMAWVRGGHPTRITGGGCVDPSDVGEDVPRRRPHRGSCRTAGDG